MFGRKCIDIAGPIEPRCGKIRETRSEMIFKQMMWAKKILENK